MASRILSFNVNEGLGNVPRVSASVADIPDTSADTAANINFTDSPDAFDVGGWHDPAGASPDEFTVPAGSAGLYIISCTVKGTTTDTDYRPTINIVSDLQGVLAVAGGRNVQAGTSGVTPGVTATAISELAVGEVITISYVTNAAGEIDGSATISIVKLDQTA